ncbi:hypothetical protein DSO57_1019086 [Entomophthora muscae]|uniref:Uncharacterized protein n=1 Tax=Entomophthora muscae TaxID=34485 RepID=A0ACC2TF22_9FUNG|nr:hypothetical protein DSO57_1019086 [Entomophthora muscae]
MGTDFQQVGNHQETYSLGNPMILNKSVKWTFDIDHSIIQSSFFTDFHIITHSAKQDYYCFEENHNLTSAKVCEVEFRRKYKLPTETIPFQHCTCLNTTCESAIIIDSSRYSAIVFQDIDSPLELILKRQQHIFPFNRSYKVQYNSTNPILFSWRPVLLQVHSRRYYSDSRPPIVYKRNFNILLSLSLDSLFRPIPDLHNNPLPSEFIYS